ncbi:MAG: glucuronate isomerase [Bacteroidales bacterium]
MAAFINPEFLLNNRTAPKDYITTTLENQPIIDFHCHLFTQNDSRGQAIF